MHLKLIESKPIKPNKLDYLKEKFQEISTLSNLNLNKKSFPKSTRSYKKKKKKISWKSHLSSPRSKRKSKPKPAI